MGCRLRQSSLVVEHALQVSFVDSWRLTIDYNFVESACPRKGWPVVVAYRESGVGPKPEPPASDLDATCPEPLGQICSFDRRVIDQEHSRVHGPSEVSEPDRVSASL